MHFFLLVFWFRLFWGDFFLLFLVLVVFFLKKVFSLLIPFSILPAPHPTSLYYWCCQQLASLILPLFTKVHPPLCTLLWLAQAPIFPFAISSIDFALAILWKLLSFMQLTVLVLLMKACFFFFLADPLHILWTNTTCDITVPLLGL